MTDTPTTRLQWAIMNADSEDVGVLQDVITVLLQEREGL